MLTLWTCIYDSSAVHRRFDWMSSYQSASLSLSLSLSAIPRIQSSSPRGQSSNAHSSECGHTYIQWLIRSVHASSSSRTTWRMRQSGGRSAGRVCPIHPSDGGEWNGFFFGNMLIVWGQFFAVIVWTLFRKLNIREIKAIKFG